MTNIDGNSLQTFANNCSSGYLKTRKAQSMAETLNLIPNITADRAGLLKFIKDCLLMEGFSNNDCVKIAYFILGGDN